MDKFRNKYRIPSARWQNWDYGSNGAYFITICTSKRVHYFGEITDGTMLLNDVGVLAEHLWLEIPQHFPFVILGNFVVMPDHVHGILMIDKDRDDDIEETRLIASPPSTEETRLIASVPEKNIGGFAGEMNPMLQENISRIIRWYKGRCSFEIRKLDAGFAWQSRFHDHVIRDARAFENIQNYIANNPANWKEDQNHLDQV